MNLSVKDENGNIYNLFDKIGSGGQGSVFKVRDNDAVVVKALCHQNSDDIISDEKTYEEYKKHIRNVISVGEFDYLAVPYVMLEKPLCGYVMLFMAGLEPISNLMLPYIYKDKNKQIIFKKDYSSKKERHFASSNDEIIFSYNHSGGLSKRLRCLARLAQILADISDKGVAYCDLSPNNVYISKDHSNYEVWLIDLDNLDYESNITHTVGTPKFMAPEIAKGKPNTNYSDRYSFALLAYQFLTFAEPFNGDLVSEYGSWEDDEVDDDAFDKAIALGEIPWIWEVGDDRNRSTKGFNPHKLLNEDLFNLFEKTFNHKGRNIPECRPSMWEWYDSLILAYESLIAGRIRYSEESFHEHIPKGNKYYNQKIMYLGSINPFNDEKSPQRYKVNISDIILLEDEEGNKDMIVLPDKTIFWSKDQNNNHYQLSNFDLYKRRPKNYIDNYITLIRQEKLFSASSEFQIVSSYSDIQLLAVENNQYINTINNLLKTTYFVKYAGEFIKRITLEMD